jgi:hypothetical protein
MFGLPEILSEQGKSQATTNYHSVGNSGMNQIYQDQPMKVNFLQHLAKMME